VGVGRYWRKESQAAADSLYREALRLRLEEQAEGDLVVRERLRRARFALTDQALALERKAAG
jgi:hypothetical protein